MLPVSIRVLQCLRPIFEIMGIYRPLQAAIAPRAGLARCARHLVRFYFVSPVVLNSSLDRMRSWFTVKPMSMKPSTHAIAVAGPNFR